MDFEEVDSGAASPPSTSSASTTRSLLTQHPVAATAAAAFPASSLSLGWLSSRSPNVPLTMCFNFLDGSCYSMWAMQLLPVFLLKTSSSIIVVSFSASVCSAAQLLGALVAGCVADRQPRQRSIRAGAGCAMVALAVFVWAFWTSRVWLIFGAQALWGLYTGITSTSVEALFADSVPQGQRTVIYNVKWVIQTVCYVVGYGAAALLFFKWGNSWDPRRVRVVMTLGVLAHPIALAPLCCLQDRYAVKEGDEDISRSSTQPNIVAVDAASAAERGRAAVTATETKAVESPVHSTLQPTTQQPPGADSVLAAGSMGVAFSHVPTDGVRLRFTDALPLSASAETFGREGCDGDAEDVRERTATTAHAALRKGLLSAPVNDSGSFQQQQQQNSSIVLRDDGEGVSWVPRIVGSLRHSRWRGLTSVPYWMCVVDLLLAIGSGMSVPYFPVFLASDREIGPAALNGIYIASTLLTAVTSMCLPWLIHTCGLGRVPAALGVRLVGTAALLMLTTAATLPGIIALFLCRNALMNSVFGITRSVIMDCVTKDSRAKWSALESVSLVSWSGSAMIGGYITKQHGYRCTFVATAVLQFVATLLMIPAALGARALDASLSNAPQVVEDLTLAVSPTTP
ncbi:Sugar (and other) transporter [Leishmania donovani]|uniref:Sugar_(And_other)_transporter_putative/Pfam:PF000 83 n=1 Tax=Leishmania donovani TaxID=5661 RepID=A0A6J8F6R7_LEIDO|nr:Sugar (and other) transporter [Leishmania donovani]VDZ43406.1 Sugar_(and_other)_transporter_putative/Pfam:PF00083 [Leishmania donovani]